MRYVCCVKVRVVCVLQHLLCSTMPTQQCNSNQDISVSVDFSLDHLDSISQLQSVSSVYEECNYILWVDVHMLNPYIPTDIPV